MIHAHSQLTKALDTLTSELQGAKAGPVRSQALREDVKSFVRSYFAQFRRTVTSGGIPEDMLSPLDAQVQELLCHSQKQTLRKKYRPTLKAIRKAVDGLELEITRRAAMKPNEGTGIGNRDQALLSTLAEVCAAAAASYRQGLMDLNDEGRLSWRGTAAQFRESLRETLDVLAPDDAVEEEPGFKLEGGARGPTMKQKTVFILKSRRQAAAVIHTAKQGVDLIEEKMGAFLRSVYSRSSVSIHRAASRDEAASIKDHVALLLAELLALPR